MDKTFVRETHEAMSKEEQNLLIKCVDMMLKGLTAKDIYIYNSMTEDQKKVFKFLLGESIQVVFVEKR